MLGAVPEASGLPDPLTEPAKDETSAQIAGLVEGYIGLMREPWGPRPSKHQDATAHLSMPDPLRGKTS
jgi:hypothetical protein